MTENEGYIICARCGQVPDDHPAFARFLVEQRIDGISLSPDAPFKTLPATAEAERGRA